MLSPYLPLCEAIVRLMDPLVEIVIHNIAKNTIVYVNGKLSHRKVGDPSLLELDELTNLENSVYPKINFDGRLVKSISIMLENPYLLCINCDVSIFHTMQTLSNSLLQVGNQPPALFAQDWQEKLHRTIHAYLQSQHLPFEHLSQSDKKKLTQHLFELGAFNEKNAADYIANVLGLGRATVFKYLKEWRNK